MRKCPKCKTKVVNYTCFMIKKPIGKYCLNCDTEYLKKKYKEKEAPNK